MERLIDDCIIMDYGRILTQQPVNELLEKYYHYTFTLMVDCALDNIPQLIHPSVIRNRVEVGSYLPLEEMRALLEAHAVPFEGLQGEHVSLEDVFIGLTGKY